MLPAAHPIEVRRRRFHHQKERLAFRRYSRLVESWGTADALHETVLVYLGARGGAHAVGG
jgi:hypothetical protein